MINSDYSKFFKNFYFLFFLFFLLWMLLIDSNGFKNRYNLYKKSTELINEIDYYEAEIKKVELERKAFDEDDKLLEKFARENYFMKKRSEDIYYVSDK